MLKRIQFELLMHTARQRATGDSPELREKPRSGRRRKLTGFLRGIAWNREFKAHGEGERRRSVSACSQHATPGRVKARGLVGVCAHLSEAVRTRGQEFPGTASLALSTLRLTTLAKTQGGASQRPSVSSCNCSWAHVVCLLLCRNSREEVFFFGHHLQCSLLSQDAIWVTTLEPCVLNIFVVAFLLLL